MAQAFEMTGTKVIYTLKDGEDWQFMPAGDGSFYMVIVHPDRPPKMIDRDGNEKPFTTA
jgi:hypothetical protein